MSVRLEGFDELIHQITNAPKAIRQEGFEIVRDETEGARTEIAQSYPVKSGRLANRVQTSYPAENVLIGIVRSAAPHSHIYEFGTQQRRTSKGANRGVMPAHKVTPDIARRRRLRMFRRLSEMLERLGFQVSA